MRLKNKRIIAILTALMMTASSVPVLPVQTFASESDITAESEVNLNSDTTDTDGEITEETIADVDIQDEEPSTSIDADDSEPIYYCGFDTEHTHTEACAKLLKIRDGEKVYYSNMLICGHENHTHTAECLMPPNDISMVEDEPYCGLEEHVHSFACLERGDLICKNKSEDHVHTEECYEWNVICGKQEHTHTDACYEKPSDTIDGESEKTHIDGADNEITDSNTEINTDENIQQDTNVIQEEEQTEETKNSIEDDKKDAEESKDGENTADEEKEEQKSANTVEADAKKTDTEETKEGDQTKEQKQAEEQEKTEKQEEDKEKAESEKTTDTEGKEQDEKAEGTEKSENAEKAEDTEKSEDVENKDTENEENITETSEEISNDKEENEENITDAGEENLDSADYVQKDDIEAADAQGKAAESEEEAKAALTDMGLSSKKAKSVAKKLFAPPLKAGTPEPRSADGSNIETIAAKWITEDTVDNGDAALLYVKPVADELQSVRMQINYALSGEHNYEPGDINIIIPAYIFKNRAGRDYGEMFVPYPENPSTKQDFNWVLDGDRIVLTNTKPMSAATKGFIQFNIGEMSPFELVDMQESEPFNARIEVLTHAGNLIALESNSITAQFDTEAKVTSASKYVYSGKQRVSAEDVPASQRIAGEEEYIKVNWYAYGYVEANTDYTLIVTDTIPDEYRGFIEGATNADGRTHVTTLPNQKVNERTRYFYYATYYPASEFEPETLYTFHNSVEFKVVETDPAVGSDPQLETAQTDSAETSFSYHLPRWVFPTGHFMVVKNGNNGKSTEVGVEDNLTNHEYYAYPYEDEHIWYRRAYISGWYGIYPSGLNELKDGHTTDISYIVNSVGYIMPWTYDPVTPITEMSARMISNYFKKPVTMTTEDTGVSLVRGGAKLEVGKDYRFVSIEFPKEPWIYSGVPVNINPDGSFAAMSAGDGTFDYRRDEDYSHMPDIKLQIFRNGAWRDWATVKWQTGACMITDAANVTRATSIIDVPADTETFRTIVTSTNAAIDYDVRPVIRLLPSEKVQELVNGAFELSKVPSMAIWNSAQMVANQEGDTEPIVTINADGYDSVRGYTTDISAVPHKESKTTLADVDLINRRVVIHYKADVEERSVINDRKTYLQAIEEGRLTPETSGIWYDLLPKGMTPLTDTVTLRDGDTVTNVYTLENYKNSGRTLLVVEADLRNIPEKYKDGDVYYWMDKPAISFDAMYDFDSMIAYGTTPHNVIAFESGNDKIGTVRDYSGEPDDPTQRNNISTESAFLEQEEITAMTNLDPVRDTPSFVYAGAVTNIDIPGAGRTSLFKDVMTNNDGLWSDGLYYGNPDENKRTVYEGGQYAYRLIMTSDADTISKGLIMFDSLENFYAATGNDPIDIGAPRWQGTLRRVDTTPLEIMGCKPVVYYSTVANLQLANESNPDEANPTNTNLGDTAIWVKASDYTGSLDAVKAVAIDARKKTDGTDFTLQPLESAMAIIEMHAPSGEPARGYIAEDAHAYNNAFLHAISIDANTGASSGESFVRKDYTKVGLEEFTLRVHKVWDDDDNRDGIRPQQAVVHLYANGTDTGKSVTFTSNETEKSFEHLPYTDSNGEKITYTFHEDSNTRYVSGIKIEGKDITVTNRHIPEKITLEGTKTWEGDTEQVRPESIKVILYGNGEEVETKTVRPDTGGRWSYSFEDVFKYENGTEIEYTVKEEMEDTIKSYVPTYSDINIVNRYHPFGELQVEKYVYNTTAVSKEAVFDFTFEFTRTENTETVPIFDSFNYDIMEGNNVISSGTVASNGIVSIKGGQKILVKELPEYINYKVTEGDKPGFKLKSSSNTTGIIQPNETAVSEFHNEYKANGQTPVSLTKKLNNRELSRYQFKFDLYNSDGEIIRSASNGRVETTTTRPDETIESSEATVSFGPLKYTQEDHGKTFTYKIKERNENKAGYTYDNGEVTFSVTVADNGDGTLNITNTFTGQKQNFENTYKAEGSIVLRAWKDLQGRNLQENEFEFDLYDEENNIIDTKKNTADGSVVFDALEFDEKDIGKKYHYYVKEKEGTDPSVVYDKSTYGYEVSVLDNGDGTLTFSQQNAKPIYGSLEDEYSDISYAVTLIGIETDKDELGHPTGLTFGPAFGFSSQYQTAQSANASHQTGTTTLGNAHRCIAGDTWSEIVYWNNEDPCVYEKCIGTCLHGVSLNLSNALKGTMTKNHNNGPGPDTLKNELNANSKTYAPNGNYDYGHSSIRAMLNGPDELNAGNQNASNYENGNALIDAFPYILQGAIAKRKVGYSADSNPDNGAANIQYVYDKLWLLSADEIYKMPLNNGSAFSHAQPYDQFYFYNTDGRTESGKPWGSGQYPGYILEGNNYYGFSNDYRGHYAYSPTTVIYSDLDVLLRTRTKNNTSTIPATINEGNLKSGSNNPGVAPGFALSRFATIPDLPIIGWETENADLPVFTNTLKPGKLSISKYVTDAETADPNQAFRFKVRLIGEGIEDGERDYTLSAAD